MTTDLSVETQEADDLCRWLNAQINAERDRLARVMDRLSALQDLDVVARKIEGDVGRCELADLTPDGIDEVSRASRLALMRRISSPIELEDE